MGLSAQASTLSVHSPLKSGLLMTDPLVLSDERMEAIATRELLWREAAELAKVSDEMRLIGVSEPLGESRPATIPVPLLEMAQAGSESREARIQLWTDADVLEEETPEMLAGEAGELSHLGYA